jgi:hypothetical protein
MDSQSPLTQHHYESSKIKLIQNKILFFCKLHSNYGTRHGKPVITTLCHDDGEGGSHTLTLHLH